MNGFLYAAITALVVGAALLLAARSARDKHRLVLLTETTDAATLRQLAAAASEAAGPGAFSEYVELRGTVHPGPAGLLSSPISETECVWHRHRITRKFKDVYRDSEGRRQTRTRDEVMSEGRTEDPFVLRDATGDLVIVPSTTVGSARKSVDDYREHDDAEATTEIGFGSFRISLPAPTSDGDTLGHTYEEWVLTPGSALFVHGEVTDASGELTVRDPDGSQKLILTTKSEEEILAGARTQMLSLAWGAAACGAIALVLLVLGVLRLL